jgi:hypothetical protein
VLDALVARPAGESAWQALRHAFEPLLDEIAESPQRGLSMARMFDETPSLRARHIGRQLTWHDRLTPEIARRLQVTDDPYDPVPAPWSPPHSRA